MTAVLGLGFSQTSFSAFKASSHISKNLVTLAFYCKRNYCLSQVDLFLYVHFNSQPPDMTIAFDIGIGGVETNDWCISRD